MANWCSNSVVFTGDAEKCKAIYDLFADIQDQQTKSDKYQLPEFVKDEKGVMAEIVIHNRGVSFETRWVPNLDLLMEIADFYQTGFVSNFNEMGVGIMGEARYDSGTLTMVTLDKEDLRAVRYDASKKGYPCGDQVFEFEGDLLDYILEQKKLDNTNIQILVQKNGLEPGR